MQFKEPSDTGALPTKSADLLRLLSEGQNVALSHELFKLLNDTAIDRIKEFDYTLFLDEEIEVVELSDITQDDLKILKEQRLIEIDPTSKRVKWLVHSITVTLNGQSARFSRKHFMKWNRI